MQEYNITIFRQSRVLFGIFLAPIIFIIAILIGAKLKSFTIPIIFLIVSFSLLYYFVIGHLIITIKENSKIIFEWKRKFIFNYKPIDTLNIGDIKTIVLDDIFLRKIKTDSNIIYINNSKDSTKFIKKLKSYTNEYDIKIIDSWDEIAEKGYLRLAYKINSFLIVIAVILIIIITISKGFKPVSLSIILLFIPQMLLYKAQMKNKIK